MKENKKNRTISVGPQNRAPRLPFIIYMPFEEPRGGPIVTGFTCSVVVQRWIRRGKPFLSLLSQLIT